MVLAAVLGLCVWTAAGGQTEKITIRRAPEPNQTVRMRMAQHVEMDMTLEGNTAALGGVPTSQKMAMKSTSLISQKTGPLSPEGNVQTQVTVEESHSESTMNGQPGAGDAATRRLVGKTIVLTIDKTGKTIDMKIPPDMGLPTEAFTQLMKSVSSGLPSEPMAVGDIVTTPLDLPIPLPVSNGTPAKMNGQAQYKLVSIEKEATGRVARFEVIMNGTLASDSAVSVPNGRIDMNMDLTLSGAGIVLQDLDRGLTRSSETKATYGGRIKMVAPGAPALPTMNVKVTMMQTMTNID
jgi:hypothetical protein